MKSDKFLFDLYIIYVVHLDNDSKRTKSPHMRRLQTVEENVLLLKQKCNN